MEQQVKKDFQQRGRNNPSQPQNSRGGNAARFGRDKYSRNKARNQRRSEQESDLQAKVILVRRVTRVVKGGKRMRFSALVVVGNSNGQVGYAIKKGMDYQDSVNKATTKAKQNLIKIDLDENFSLKFSSLTKHKSSVVFLKPAKSGTGLIAGGFLRPVLELAGIKNLYSKIVRSRNKIAGVQAVLEALKRYSSKNDNL
jgi:small subunit ribosomal protein S5